MRHCRNQRRFPRLIHYHQHLTLNQHQNHCRPSQRPNHFQLRYRCPPRCHCLKHRGCRKHHCRFAILIQHQTRSPIHFRLANRNLIHFHLGNLTHFRFGQNPIRSRPMSPFPMTRNLTHFLLTRHCHPTNQRARTIHLARNYRPMNRIGRSIR